MLVLTKAMLAIMIGFIIAVIFGLIAFDNIADTYNFNPANFISKTINNCNELGIKVSFTSYYCRSC